MLWLRNLSLKWFNAKFKRQFDKINPIQKLKFISQNPINWKRDKYVICKFPMKLEPKNYMTPDNKMTFGDFIIRSEHTFLGNIYTTKQVEKSDHIKSLESYYEIFKDYIMIFNWFNCSVK